MCENIGIIVDGEGVDFRGFMYTIVWITTEKFSSTYQQRLTCTSLFWFSREDSLSKGSLTLFALCNFADIEPISLKSRQTNIPVTTLRANDLDEGKDGEVEFSILEGNVLVTTLFISFEIHFKY